MPAYKVHPIVTTRYAVMRITEDAAEIVKFKNDKGEEYAHFNDELGAKLAMEKLIERERSG